MHAAAPISLPPLSLLPSPITVPQSQSQWRSQRVWLGFSAFLRSRPHIAARGSGESPAAKRFLVHFKHYFHREWIEKQILNSKIGVLIYNKHYRVLHN